MWKDAYLSIAGGLEPLDRVGASPESIYKHDALAAILSAGAGTAESIVQAYDDYFSQFDPLAVTQAVGILEITTFAMMSRWVRRMAEQDTHLDRPRLWSAFATDVLSLFHDDTEAHYAESWWMDVQFNFALDLADAERGVSAIHTEHRMIVALCAAACGATLNWRPSRPPIPLTTAYEMAQAGWEPPEGMTYKEWVDLEREIRMFSSMMAAEAGMYAAYKAVRETR